MKLKNISVLSKKKNDGFTLIEVMLAIIVLGISVTTLYGLYSQLMRGIFSAHDIIERMIIMNNLLIQANKEKWYEKKEQAIKKIDDPASTINYVAEGVKKDFCGYCENLFREEITIEWSDIFGNREESFLTYQFIPEIESK